MKVTAIAAVSENWVIGYKNDIPWYLSDDMKFFKKATLDRPVIMGRKTFESIGTLLPKRTNIIVTRQLFYVVSGGFVVHSVEEALELAEEQGAMEAVIIGGGDIYEQSAQYWDKIYLTRVHTSVEGDVYFPEITLSDWKILDEKQFKANEKNDFDFTIQTLERVDAEDV